MGLSLLFFAEEELFLLIGAWLGGSKLVPWPHPHPSTH